MKEMFETIIDKDEEIIKVYKPNKRRFVLMNIIGATLSFIPMLLFFALVGILALTGNMEVINEDGSDGNLSMGLTFVVLAILVVLAFVFIVISRIVRYKKTFYAFSNKRILIRSGFIGVDFMVLEMQLIGAIAINVGLFDKVIKPNTGSIRFGSNSTPMGVNQNRVNEPSFAHIDNVYETYREIKEVVDTHRR